MESIIKNLLFEKYELSGAITTLPGYDDLNFKLQTEEQQSYTIKLMHPDCQADNIAFQCATLIHLEQQPLDLQTPIVKRSKAGHPFEMVEIENQHRILWVLSWLPGTVMGSFKPHTNELMFEFGNKLAKLTNALDAWEHASMKNGHIWELTQAMQVQPYAQHIVGSTQAIAEQVFEHFEKEILPKLQRLPHSVIHNDANENNTLIQLNKNGKVSVSGLFDFGDIGFQPTICELAIALAYGIMGMEHPIRACYHFLKGYSSIRQLSSGELEVLFHLVKTRLAVSIAFSSYRQLTDDDPYIPISQAPAKALLQKLHQIPDQLALAFFRKACGYPVTKNSEQVSHFLKEKGTSAYPVIQMDRMDVILDLSVGSTLLGAHPNNTRLEALTQKINAYMTEQNSSFSIGRYLESRRLYAAAGFGDDGHATQEKRCIHLGIDIFCDAGTPVYAPFDGNIEIATIIDLPLDYGGVIFLKHETDEGIPFYTLYGHLSHSSIKNIQIGQKVKAGDLMARLGEEHENGGWTPHLHLQIITDLIGLGQSFPGVAFQTEIEIWKSLSPNPMLLFDVERISDYDAHPNPDKLFKQRQEILGGNLSLSYQHPLHIVSGYRQFLYDSYANTYLDFYNNVPHVGHQHPHVVQAIQKQTALLNTNTRYLHENILNYAAKLVAKLPAHLEVCYFTNSASEANELALRLARTYTQRKDIMVVESAYHGHTTSLIDISPYKHAGPGGQGPPDWVHTVPIADDFRGPWKRDHPDAGALYAKKVQDKLKSLETEGQTIAAFIAETYPSVGGQIIPPDGYLKAVYQYVKNHGALCIADEVQTGFGRLGTSFWAFETQDVSPDIVVLGKPIANGYPLGAVVTTRSIAEAFDNGMEYFSTFGGNPVACAAGAAVLEVIEQEHLQENAATMGKLILEQFQLLQEKYPLIGDVRGEGLYLGIELVRNAETLEPADREADYIINRLKDHRILAGTDGPLHNVLKFRPSMVINEADVTYCISILDKIFGESYLRSE